jgi:hypothetical protein
MDEKRSDHPIPDGYVQLKGSERRPPRRAKLAGDVDGSERFSVTIVLRRRKDGPAMPDFEYFTRTPPRKRTRFSGEEFTEKYGAHPDEIGAVEEFARKNGLVVKSSNATRRHVVVEGTANQFSKAFGVSFKRYELPPAPEHPSPKRKPALARRTTYRGRDGYIHVPRELAESIVGVFGLDNRPIGGRSNLQGDTPIANLASVAEAASVYKFPAPSASIGAQTIGIVCAAGGGVGFMQSDLNQTYSAIGATAPVVSQISPDPSVKNPAFTLTTTAAAGAGTSILSFNAAQKGAAGSYYAGGAMYSYNGKLYHLRVADSDATTITFNAYNPATQSWGFGFLTPIPANTPIYFNVDGETTQDLAIAGLAAVGANLACYFINDTQDGWVGMMGRVLVPEPGDFPTGVNPPSVISSSYYISGGDDPDGLAHDGVTTGLMDAISQAFQDATILGNGATICVATGDFGSNCGVGSEIGDPTVGDGYAHVQYPASDPWVLGVGGTTLGQYLPAGSSAPQWVEFAWNAPFQDPNYPWGAGGGGISDHFPAPSYQAQAGIPNSINPGITAPNPSTIKPPTAFKATGRGVPDVAANANYRTGFSGIAMGGVLGGQIGNGTSASAPLWAGLIALLNSNAGINIGFANPTLYTLGAGAFNPINPLWRDPTYPQLATCPTDNANSGIPGYPTKSGWDAVTGLGSPNGMAILSGFEAQDEVNILGGYQSPDIILTDLTINQPVPIGGQPNGKSDTLLVPSTNYGFSAKINNDGPNEATGVMVRFWAIPGGLSASGTMVGTPQTVNIPANSTVIVNASAPFQSAPAGGHTCAAVSIYSPTTGCAVDATTALDIPDPGSSMTHRCSAWRNTDSSGAGSNGAYRFQLGLVPLPVHSAEPIRLTVTTKHVPVEILKTPALSKIADTLRVMGARSNQPLYLIPDVLQRLAAADAGDTVKGVHGIEVKPGGKGEWSLHLARGAGENSLEVSGQVPKTAKKDDVLLVHVAARYPRIEKRPARTVEFLQFVYVTNRKR